MSGKPCLKMVIFVNNSFKLLQSILVIGTIFINIYSDKVSALSINENQCKPYTENIWFTFGVEPILLSAGHMSLNYVATPNIIISARTAGVNDAALRTITLIGLIDGAEYTSDAGILCGLLYNGNLCQLSASAGLAYVEGRKNASFFNDKENFSTLGVPLELQAFWKPFDHFGLGVIGFGNINSKRSFAGAVLALRISF